MDDEERFDRLLDVLVDLRETNETVPVVVEGQRDVTALRLLGLKGRIVTLHRGDPLFLVAEALGAQAQEVVLLTDWDTKGQALFESLRVSLAANGVRVNGAFRDDLRHWIRPTLNDVESLASYVGRNLARYHRRDLGDL